MYTQSVRIIDRTLRRSDGDASGGGGVFRGRYPPDSCPEQYNGFNQYQSSQSSEHRKGPADNVEGSYFESNFHSSF